MFSPRQQSIMDEIQSTGLSVYAKSRGASSVSLIEAFDMSQQQGEVRLSKKIHAFSSSMHHAPLTCKIHQHAQEYEGLLQGLFVQAALALRIRHPSLHSLLDMHIEGGPMMQRAIFKYEYRECSSLRKIISQWYNSSSQGLPLAHVKRITYQLVQAISHLHSKGILHGGLCPESLLLRESGILKVGGLCYASMVPKVSRGSPLRLPPPLHYMSPELILSDIRGLSADIWSIGCIAGELAAGWALFPGKSESNQLRLIAVDVGVSSRQLTIFREREDVSKILHGISHHEFDTHFRDKYKDLDRGLIDFLSLCLQPDISKRASIEELLKSPFLQEAAVECNQPLAEEEERLKATWNETKAKSLSTSFVAFAFALKGLNARLLDAADSIAMPLPPELTSFVPPPAPARPRSPPMHGDERISPNRISPNMNPVRGGLSSASAALFGAPPPAVPWLKKQGQGGNQSGQQILMSRIASAGMAPIGQGIAPSNRTSGPKLAPLAVPKPARVSGDNVQTGAIPSPSRYQYDAHGKVLNEFGDELDPAELPARISDSHRSKIENWLSSSPPPGHTSAQHHSSQQGTFASEGPVMTRSHSQVEQRDRLPALRMPSLGQGASRGPLASLDYVSSDIRTSHNGQSILAPRTSSNGGFNNTNQPFILPPHHSFLPSPTNTYRALPTERLSGGGRPLLPLQEHLSVGSASPATALLHPDMCTIAPSLGNLSISRAPYESYAQGGMRSSLDSYEDAKKVYQQPELLSAFGKGAKGPFSG